MDKAPDAFRTISEVADFLDTPAHVLRFWESRFPQIRPVKRAGGRRYYRPADVALLTGIKRLLHDEGMTIRGVQKVLREQGVRHVAGLSGEPVSDDIDIHAEAALDAALSANFGVADEAELPAVTETAAVVVSLETALRRVEAAKTKVATVDLFAETIDVPATADLAKLGNLAADTAADDSGQEDDSVQEAGFIEADDSFDDAKPVYALPYSAAESTAADSIAARLRALPHSAMQGHLAQATALRDRMVSLRIRLLAQPASSAD